MSENTALAVFAYKRASHLERTLNSLSRSKEFSSIDTVIYLDGPRLNSDLQLTKEVYKLACKYASLYPRIKIVQNSVNVGLFESITKGISKTLESYESIIISEDDLEFSPYALEYFIKALNKYRHSQEVASIHAFMPDITATLPDSFFLRGADCWGWATWRDRWKYFRADAKEMALEIRRRGLRNEFTLNAGYDHLSLLDERAEFKSNSWAICWHASCFLANKLTLYPGKSLVNNFGQDGSGEHCKRSSGLTTSACNNAPTYYPTSTIASPKVFESYASHLFKHKRLAKKIFVKTKYIANLFLDKSAQRRFQNFSLQGPFSSYAEALTNSTGYNHDAILKKVSNATIGLLENHGTYERDGTLFASRPKDLAITKILKQLIRDRFSVIDFGGGLGGTYFNHPDIFNKTVNYVVVEQDSFAEEGMRIAREYNLPIRFAHSVHEITFTPSIVILSGVLPYLDSPYDIAAKISMLRAEYIIIDRTAIARDSHWWLQNEPFYYDQPVSYPFHPLNKQDLLATFNGYTIIKSWRNQFDPRRPAHIGFLLKKNDYR